MSIISRLGVILGLDSAEFNKGMGLANKSLTSFATVGNAARLGVVAFAKELLTLADQIEDVAKANEVSIASVVQLNIAMQQAGGSAEGAARSFSALTNKVDDAIGGNEKIRQSFAKIGITLKDLETLGISDLYNKTIKGLAGLEDGVKRNALAFDLLGKSIRGTDIKDLNQGMEQNAELAKDAEEEIGNMAKSWENLGVQFYKLKVVFMDLFGPVIDLVVDSLSFLLDILTKIMQVANKITEAISKGFKYLTSGQWGKDLKDAYKSQQQLIDEYKGAQAPNFSTGKGSVLRPAQQTDEQKKITQEIEKQNEALNKQVRELQLAAKSVGLTKSEYQKLLLEFEKGGKYDKISDIHQRNKILVEAFKLDKANQDEFIKNEIRKADIAKERYRIEGLMAGESDTAKQKALEYLSIQEELLEIKRENLNITDEELAKIAEAKIKMVEMADASRRANNTFQAGWSNAFENWKEKANDSFSMGEQAFTSMTDSMSNAMDRFVETGKLSFKSLIGDMIKQLLKLSLQAQLSGFFGMIAKGFGFGGGVGGGGGLLGTAPSGGGLALSWSAGGNELAGGQPSMVGENGPELFIPKSAGTIVPNNRMNSLMGNQPQIVYNGPYIANMSAIDTQSGLQFLAKNKQAVWSANQSAQRSLPQSR